jgi:hypothetical protein
VQSIEVDEKLRAFETVSVSYTAPLISFYPAGIQGPAQQNCQTTINSKPSQEQIRFGFRTPIQAHRLRIGHFIPDVPNLVPRYVWSVSSNKMILISLQNGGIAIVRSVSG